MTPRACLRLLLLAALLLAPLGRIGIAQAMAAPAGAGPMAGHCAEMPAAAPAHHGSGHHQKGPERDGEAMCLRLAIEIGEQRARRHERSTPGLVDCDRHAAQGEIRQN